MVLFGLENRLRVLRRNRAEFRVVSVISASMAGRKNKPDCTAEIVSCRQRLHKSGKTPEQLLSLN